LTPDEQFVTLARWPVQGSGLTLAPPDQIGSLRKLPDQSRSSRRSWSSVDAHRVGPVAHSDPFCDLAHGIGEPSPDGRTLVAIFASPVAGQLLHFGRHLGFRTILVDPEPVADPPPVDQVARSLAADFVDGTTDLVVTDHDRPELGAVLLGALALPARWIGVMGSPRHPAPHVPALRELGAGEPDIARVHRPIGLNIGSHTPAEIAIATLAGLLADRNGRPGGFAF
jgi:xanthine/CO dehydrogenase XdhC/CoxF family maturation factor